MKLKCKLELFVDLKYVVEINNIIININIDNKVQYIRQ